MRALAVAALVGLALLPGRDLGAQNPAAPAAYATLNLNAGFMPDPAVTNLTAGGSIRVGVGNCSFGFVANAPDVKLQYRGNGSNSLYIYAQSGSDVTLLINLPDGSWVCDDDGLGGTNPLIFVPNAPSGRYDIWVGTYGQDTSPAQLMVSELNPRR